VGGGGSELKSEGNTEANEEKIEAVAEHWKLVQHVKTTRVLTAVQGRASDVLHGVPKDATYEGTVGATEDRFADQHLAVESRSQVKTRTQDSGESLQEFSTAIEQLTHHAFPALHKDHVCRGTGKAFCNGIRDRAVKQHLCLGCKRTLNQALRHTLGLEVVKLTVWFSVRLWKTGDRVLWRSRPPAQTEEETTYRINAGAAGAPATWGSSVPQTGRSNCDAPVGYLGRQP
jgi:hypothetical protein